MYKFLVVLLITANVFAMESTGKTLEELTSENSVTLLIGGQEILVPDHEIESTITVEGEDKGLIINMTFFKELGRLFKLEELLTNSNQSCQLCSCELSSKEKLVEHILSRKHLGLQLNCPSKKRYLSVPTYQRHKMKCQECKNPPNCLSFYFLPNQSLIKKKRLMFRVPKKLFQARKNITGKNV